MTVTSQRHEAWLFDSIRAAVRQKLDAEMKTEMAEMTKRVEAAVAKQMDELALVLLKHYHVTTMRDEIVITVKKP